MNYLANAGRKVSVLGCPMQSVISYTKYDSSLSLVSSTSSYILTRSQQAFSLKGWISQVTREV